MLLIPAAAFFVSIVLHGLSLKIFPKLGLLDFPDRYGLTRKRIPYPTGIISIILFLGLSPFLLPKNFETLGLVFGIVALGILCFFDDRTPLSPRLRIGMQLLITIVIVWAGIRVDAITNPLPFFLEGDSVQLTNGYFLAFSIIFTIIWLLLTINALNWFDGIPGQVSTLTTIGFVTIGFLSMSERVNQPSLALIAFVLAGLSAAALLFDFPPAKVLMGDSGAMFFGLMIGVLTIYSGGKVATAFLVLGVPLIDLFFVIVRRLKRGQSIIRGNALDQHLHHRLLARGWSQRQVIILTSLIGASFGIIALFLSTRGKILSAGILFLVMLLLSWYSGSKGKHIH